LTQFDGRGLLFDRDVVAFYGDPGWDARMAETPLRWVQSLQQDGNRYTFEIEPLQGQASFATVNVNGAQRGGRPLVQRLPYRVSQVKVVAGAQFHPFIADDFILVPRPAESVDQPIRIEFKARSENAK
jgi:zinc protease